MADVSISTLFTISISKTSSSSSIDSLKTGLKYYYTRSSYILPSLDLSLRRGYIEDKVSLLMCCSAVIHCAGQQAAVCHLLAGVAMTHAEPEIITSARPLIAGDQGKPPNVETPFRTQTILTVPCINV